MVFKQSMHVEVDFKKKDFTINQVFLFCHRFLFSGRICPRWPRLRRQIRRARQVRRLLAVPPDVLQGSRSKKQLPVPQSEGIGWGSPLRQVNTAKDETWNCFFLHRDKWRRKLRRWVLTDWRFTDQGEWSHFQNWTFVQRSCSHECINY